MEKEKEIHIEKKKEKVIRPWVGLNHQPFG